MPVKSIEECSKPEENGHSQKDRKSVVFKDQLSPNVGQNYCRMLQGEHSTILSTFIKLPFVIKIFVLSIFEWPFYTVYCSANIETFPSPLSKDVSNDNREASEIAVRSMVVVLLLLIRCLLLLQCFCGVPVLLCST